jgi:AcrR family transcriptional regulator
MELHIRTELLHMMQEMPFERIKVRALADRATIGRSTFYLYYDAVDSVLEQIESDFFEELRAYVSATDSKKPVALAQDSDSPDYLKDVERGLLFLREQSLTVLTLCGSHGDPAFKDALSRQLSHVVSGRFGIASHNERVDTIPSFVIEYVAKGWFANVLRWLEEESAAPDELATLFGHLLLGASLTCKAMEDAKKQD